ncbi:unnamed protein product [Polarella glacialis]|uniref:Uncharacterized protein n=1 Tax=Polarella glacialis TaxID=89957 RepID=A0A813FAT6_POLGL|nr:unnamed protein product [Polarella glacialis]
MMSGLQPRTETATSQASGARGAKSQDSATAASRKWLESRASTAVLAHGVLQVPATAIVCGSFMADILQQVCTVRCEVQRDSHARDGKTCKYSSTCLQLHLFTAGPSARPNRGSSSVKLWHADQHADSNVPFCVHARFRLRRRSISACGSVC